MSENIAAWSPEPKGDLALKEAPMYEVHGEEILIKNEAIAIQPFDAKVRKFAYGNVDYPAILGASLAGTVVAVYNFHDPEEKEKGLTEFLKIGEKVTKFQLGDEVVTDTPVYNQKLSRFGAWQKYVVGLESLSAKINNSSLNKAVALPFALQTAVAALHVYLGMPLPGSTPPPSASEKVLIWGAGGSVGGYAVQFAHSVGYTVIATASPRASAHLLSIGASQVLDYKSPSIISDLYALGPFSYLFTTSGDAASQTALATLLQPLGGKFASVLPKSVEVEANVEVVYGMFASTTQLKGVKFEDFGKWWYGEYLPQVIADGSIEATEVTMVKGGLGALQGAADRLLEGKGGGKLVVNPQE